MTIDFIISNLGGGGAQRVLILLANALSKKGHEISIITFNDQEDYVLDEKIKRVRLHKGKIKNHTIRSFINLFKYYKNKDARPDVILSFITLTNLISIVVSKFYNIKVIACEHNSHLRNTFKTDKFTKQYVYRFADYVTVLTNFDVAYYEKHKAKIVVMPNPATFTPITINDFDREKTILVIGALNRYKAKGFDNMMTILKPVFQEFPEWKVKVLGKGEQGMQELKELAIKSNIEKNVTFLGFQKNVNEIMQKSEIFMLPSLYEGLPMVLVEAMSQGMACIAYDCTTGPSDILTNGVDGLLIEDQNQKEMEEGLITLIKSKEMRLNLSNNAIKSVDRYHIDIIISKWTNLFKKL